MTQTTPRIDDHAPAATSVPVDAFSAVIVQRHGLWCGWVQQLPGVECQAGTRDELISSLTEELRLAIDFYTSESRSAAGEGGETLQLAL